MLLIMLLKLFKHRGRGGFINTIGNNQKCLVNPVLIPISLDNATHQHIPIVGAGFTNNLWQKQTIM